MKKLAFLLILIVSLIGICQGFLYTKRASNHLREGAGSFYPLLDVISANVKIEILEKSGKWIKVKLPDGRIGWLSDQSVANQSETKVPTQTGNTPTKVSKASITAAIKGFAQKIKSADLVSLDYLVEFPNTKFSAYDFQNFIVPLKYQKSSNIGELDMSDLDFDIPNYDPDLNELKIGYTVATRLAAKGLVKDEKLTKYVNLIAATIVNKNNIYDYDFNIYILDDNTVNGFACPGGMIFLTKGAVQKCSDESELAGIIAHEIMHIVRKHGLQETTQRKVNIKSDDAFGELESDMAENMTDEDKKYAEVEAELVEMAEQSYEKVVHKRLLAYELEADKGSSVLLANAGYDPFGIVRATAKLAAIPKPKVDIFDSDYLAPDDAKIRAEKIKNFCEDEFNKKKPGARMEERFSFYTR